MLSDEDRSILEFERGWWLLPGPKDQVIELALGLSAAAYYERLVDLVATTAAYRFDPLTVARVRRLIEDPPLVEEVT